MKVNERNPIKDTTDKDRRTREDLKQEWGGMLTKITFK